VPTQVKGAPKGMHAKTDAAVRKKGIPHLEKKNLTERKKEVLTYENMRGVSDAD